MDSIYVMGAGAIGLPLAVFLANAGRTVLAVRTSRGDVPRSTIDVNLRSGDGTIAGTVPTVSLSLLERVEGIVVVTSKAYANGAICRELERRGFASPLVIMQNGLGVEEPFLETGFPSIYRCILYVTSQGDSGRGFDIRAVAPSPIGIVRGDEQGLRHCVGMLNTAAMPFRAEHRIDREIWRKTIINAVFNSICPLLEIDNGIFARDTRAAALAAEVVKECVTLTGRLDIDLAEDELMTQIRAISRSSDGQPISTLQDIRAGRETEIEFLNLAIARAAARLQPPLPRPRVALLGSLVALKSARCDSKSGSAASTAGE